jgi:hypothetical protein
MVAAAAVNIGDGGFDGVIGEVFSLYHRSETERK